MIVLQPMRLNIAKFSTFVNFRHFLRFDFPEEFKLDVDKKFRNDLINFTSLIVSLLFFKSNLAKR